MGELHIIFDGPPGPEAGRFVEVETPDGKSVNAGKWEQRSNYWHLIIPDAIESQAKRIAELEAITKIECGLQDCLIMPREDDQGPLFYQPANSTLVLAKLRDYAIIPRAKYHELEAEVAALRVDAAKLSQYLCDEQEPYHDVGDFLDNSSYTIGDTFELTKCYAEKKPTRFRVVSCGLDICGEPIIDVEEIGAAKEQQ